jgi:tRNA-splicing endonuclease subunit Sen2
MSSLIETPNTVPFTMSSTPPHPAQPVLDAEKLARRKSNRKPNYSHIHRNPLPLEIYPLPVLIPHNPLSLLAIALSYLAQVLAPPPRQPLYNGYFSSATSSVHVTNASTARRLWEMGFFGKGSLSRSEPTWLESQKRKGETSEEVTRRRRAERRGAKLDRARKEQQAIAKKLEEEEKMEEHTNGSVDVHVQQVPAEKFDNIATVLDEAGSRTPTLDKEEVKSNGQIEGFDEWKKIIEANGVPTPPPTSVSSENSNGNGHSVRKVQKIKVVRFSPTIEAREFDLSSPVISPIKSPGASPLVEEVHPAPAIAENQEHLQLSLEEAFFLVYGLGVLQIYCDDSDTILPASSLLPLFRRHSYFPPRSISAPAEPDDPFMLSYAAYHHYRSLGWVVRSGIKFSVDFLLYNRGPAFSHAEFALIILPSYSHAYWSETDERRKAVAEKTGKSWWWLHGMNRVQAQVVKTLVLCYVDVPPPLTEEERGYQADIAKLFARYRIRDVTVKRWTPNRTRD